MKKTLLIVVILTIFLNGCIGLTQTDTSNQQSWRTGTQGIVMSFVPNNPPSEVVSTSDVNVIVKTANKGANTATNLRFYLTGYDDSILSGLISPVKHPPSTLEGKTRFNPEGSQETFVEWTSGINMASLTATDSFEQTVVVTACYRYETYAEPQICIDPTQFDVIGPSKCDFDINGLGSSQGGPIAITKVEKKLTTDQIFLEIEFQNKGGGNPFVSGNCLNLKHDEIDKIKIENVGKSGLSFSCNPSEVRLVNNKGFTICTSNNMPGSRVETPLPIKVWYNYRDTLPKKEITIVNIQPRN